MNEDPTIPIEVDLAGKQDAPAERMTWGSFTLLARVGYGGFGEVYRAWDPHLQREVALKLLLPGEVGGDAEYSAMLREARALASVRHPNIVPIHGIDRHDGRVGFWTDFVRGKTLSVLVAEQGRFGPREAALIGLDVARAVSAVHLAGLLHRDIKAENVMREEGGRIVLMDFGLSALEHRQTTVAGTPNYMAPELFQHGHSSVATDIYAIGVLLYVLVTGEYPARLSGLSPADAPAALANRKPLMDLRPDLPESLMHTVSTAMELDPAKRFTSAGHLAGALAEALGTHAPVEVSTQPELRTGKGRGARWLFAGLLSLAVVLAGSLVWMGYRARSSHGASGSDSSLSATSGDQFADAQRHLMRSYKESELSEAVTGFQAVLKADPNNALAEARLGDAYLSQHGLLHDPKLLDMARDAANRAITLDRDHKLAAPYITLSRIEALEGQTELATQQVQKALELEPRSAEAHGALGEVYEAQGRTEEAIVAYQQAIDLAPDDWRWPMSLGVAEFGQGNIAESIAQLKRGADLAPDNAVAYFDLSIALSQSQEIEEAQQDVQRSIEIEPTARAYSLLGSLLMYEGKYDDSVAAHKKAIQMNPSNYNAFVNLGDTYRWSGTHKEEATEAYRRSIELGEAEHTKKPRDPELLATLAYAYAQTRNTSKSAVLARQSLALASDNPTVCFYVGEAYEVLGQRAIAIPLIATALANGYHTYEFERDPQFAALRADSRFAAELRTDRAKKK